VSDDPDIEDIEAAEAAIDARLVRAIDELPEPTTWTPVDMDEPMEEAVPYRFRLTLSGRSVLEPDGRVRHIAYDENGRADWFESFDEAMNSSRRLPPTAEFEQAANVWSGHTFARKRQRGQVMYRLERDLVFREEARP
jgi:hypothetical protein